MTLEDTIWIDAPPATVWVVTEDVERWPEGTPTVSSVTRADEAPLGVGSVVRIKQPGQPEAAWTVTEFVLGERFAWETQRFGLKMRAAHIITPDGDGTQNTLRLKASGFVAKLLAPLRPLVQRALREENRGLNARCESIA